MLYIFKKKRAGNKSNLIARTSQSAAAQSGDSSLRSGCAQSVDIICETAANLREMNTSSCHRNFY